MRLSNIQDKKLNIIEQLIIINDEIVIDEVEKIIHSSLQRPNLKKFTKEEFIERIRLSELDIENGDYFTQEQVKQLSKEW